MSKPVFSDKKDWPSGRVRLTLLATFGGLLALMVFADLNALRIAKDLQSREEEVRQSFLARSQILEELSSAIHAYSERIQQFILSQASQNEEPSIAEFKKLAAQIDSSLNRYPGNRQPQEEELLGQLQRLFAIQRQILNPVLSWNRAERQRRALQLLTEEVLPQSELILETSEKIAIWNREQIAVADRELFASFASLQGKQMNLLIITLIAGLLLSLASMLYISRLERQGQRRYHELARSRSDLEQLSARLVDAQETERRSISRELHDEVGQSLGVLLMDVGRLSALVPADNTQISDNAQIKAYVDKIKALAENTVQNVRDIALLLRPSMLDDLGLEAALEWQAREVSRRSEIEVNLRSDGVSERLSDECKICIYRLVQEALNNAARHSGGRNASVSVRQDSDKILLSVADDGHGFDPARARGLGILGMEERVRRLGGKLSIDSKPGQGTTLNAELPLSHSSTSGVE